MKKPIIWILGGMWPEASCYLYKEILEYYQQKYGAVQDSEYPHLIINSMAMGWFSEKGVEDEALVKQELLAWVHQLEQAGVSQVIIACNTVHMYYDYLQSNSTGIIKNLIEETVKQVSEKGITEVLVLWSETTHIQGLYDSYLEKYGVGYTKVSTSEQQVLNGIIENVMQSDTSKKDMQYILELNEKYHTEAIVMACTELPIVAKDLALENMFDTISVLVEMCDIR